MRFSPIEHHGPCIAVKFYSDELLLVGNGPLLKVYNHITGEVLTSKKIFKRNKIHGIVFQRDTVGIYGARSFSILSMSQILEDDALYEEEKMVNDWIIAGEFCSKGWELYLLTAHNVVLSVDSYSKTLQWERSVFGEKSILYSGSIKVLSQWEVMVNAGTVMDGIIIWDLHRQEVVHALKGHEGSIFSVQSSAENKYIVSCSDDRSIKLWSAKTGELKSTAWGHTARIWNLKFIGDEGVVSVSEDLTARTWRITEDEQLVPVHTYELHNGRHIWGLDVNAEGTIAATGGNDGRVRLIDITVDKVDRESETFTLEQIASQCQDDYQVQKKEIVKGFWQLQCGLVLITSFGGIFQYRDGKWSFVAQKPEFNNLTLTNGFTNQNVMTFTGSNGHTVLMKFDQEGKLIKEEAIHTPVSKVINVLSAVHEDDLYLLVESPNKQDKLTLYALKDSLQVTRQLQLTKAPTFVTTCFEVSSTLIFMGFRLSSLGIYDLETGEELKLIKKLSLSDTITSIRLLQETGDDVLLAITNRDGLYVYLRYNKSSNEHVFVHTNNIRKGFLEGSLTDVDSDDFIVYGFKSSWFYIYNESRDFEVAYENCGGAHRIWKLFHDSNGYKFVYVRDGSLHIRNVPKSPLPLVLSEGTHGREIRDIAVRQGCEKLLNITGAEDTTMKLSTMDKTTGQLRNYWTVRKHTSGLQKVKFLSEDLVASSSAREEFFVWRIDEQFKYPLIALIGTLQPSSTNPDLRIMDFSHKFVYQDGSVVGVFFVNVYSDSTIKSFYFNLSTNQFTPVFSGRYKTSCLWDVRILFHDDSIYILVGGTDGHLSVWNVTQHVPFTLADGQLQLQQLGETKTLSKWDCLVQVHQNGIKDLEVFPDEQGFSVVTAGDDNGLGLVKFILSDSVVGKVVAFEASAASSTLTSLSKISGKRVAAISVDQTSRLWSIDGDKLELCDSLYTTVADTGSSDATTIGGKNYLLVGGIGLSLWEVV